jgi:hypothetical protein
MDTITPRPALGAPLARWRPLLLAAFFLAPGSPARALTTDEMLGNAGGEKADEEVTDMLGLQSTRDWSQLGSTHLSMLSGWDRLPDGSLRTLLAVPEEGRYRLFLQRQLSIRKPLPVTLTLTPQAATPRGTNAPAYADSGAPLKQIFGAITLAGGQTGKEQEKALPIRFEAETQLISPPPEPALVWEYKDLDLKKGIYAATLSEAHPEARPLALLLTRSADFRPSFSPAENDKTLGRLYLRFRATGPAPAGATFTAGTAASYHWGPRGEAYWSWPIGTAAATPIGEWSPFIEATDALFNGPGPWSTCWIHFGGIKNGQADVQFAWFPHEKAVQLSTRTGIGNGVAMLRVPNGDWSVKPASGIPAWGLWMPARLNSIMTQESVIERYFTWADQAAKQLDLRPDHPRPHRVRIYTGCGIAEPNRERAAEMLARLGVSWIEGAPESVIRKYGLIDDLASFHGDVPEKDRARVTKVKMGDEIITRTDPSLINGDVAKRRAFQAYLAEQARLEGMEANAFLGVPDLNDLDCMGPLPPNPSRYERRLFYHSQRFCHLITCDSYAARARAIEKTLPNARIYNNYTPHPVFLTGATMNDMDWFVLARHQAQTLGWGEDWATGGSWGLGTAYQCTSFYAALVDCSVRKYGYAAGFYVGSNVGGSAQKIFGCLAQGVSWLHLYDWGPVDRWAEGSNAWSENQGEYYSIMAATHAIGPADEILADGKREPRRTALLYNRSHEILQGGLGRANHDWMWTFIALKGAQIPVDVILEEDLNPGDLERYDVVILGGLNLARYHLAALRKWVEAGGLLIGTSGAASLDIYNDPMPETADLFGAVQKRAGASDTASVARVTFPQSEWFPAAELKAAASLAFHVEPTAGKPLATFGNGQVAAAGRALGKGQTLLLGMQPGILYRDNGRSAGGAGSWLTAPVLKRLGRQRVEFDWPNSEATLFEHASGLAVMLADFARPSRESNGVLSVQTDRPVKSVASALKGPLEWKRNGDRIDIVTPPLRPVDVIILK